MSSAFVATSPAFVFATFASAPAASADCCAWLAAPCADCAFLSTSEIAPSFLRVRSCVSSTDVVRVSTLPLTSPTRFLTNPLVAHAGRPMVTTPASVSADIHFDMYPPELEPATRSRPGDVPASCANHEVVALVHTNQQRMPARGRTRLERHHVLVPQFRDDLPDRHARLD